MFYCKNLIFIPHHTIVAGYYGFMLHVGLLIGKFHQIFVFWMMSKCQGILTKLGTCIDMKEIWFGIAFGQISSMFDRVICPRHDNGGAL